MHGSLTPDALARVLRGLAVSRKEGILHLSRDGVSKRIYFKNGSIIFAGSDDDQERLGEVLVRAGKLERADLELALKVTKETGESLGKTITEMGFTSTADIAAHALERAKSVICSVFAWQSGSFHFEERTSDVSDEVALELSTHELILEAARSFTDPAVVRGYLGGLKAVLRQPANPLVPYQEGSLSSSLEWLLYQANGISTIEEIVSSSPLDETRTLQSIYALVLAGVLEIESPEKAMAARTDNTKVSLAGPQTRSPEFAMSTPSVATVSKTIGRYEVQGVLGSGAMGAVYLVKDPAIDRMVAIKLIQTALQLDPSELEKYRERFYREAKSAGKLVHPGIVTVFDVGHTDEETPFIVMEYVEGQTLEEILKAKKLDHEQILRHAAEILDALAFAHSKGIVHRDIKPANILVTADGAIKIMDFGIAHVIGSDMTQADDVLGSPNYMAPEQLSKGSIDARTDLFAFGIVLYRMLTGTLPFQGDSFAAIAKAVLFEDPLPPASVDPTIPSDLSEVVVRCLSKVPALRFATANELKSALTSLPHDRLRDRGVVPAPTASSARESSVPPKPPDTEATGPSGWSPGIGQIPAVSEDRGNRRYGIRFGLAAALGLAVALFVAVRFFGGEPSATDSAPQQQETAPATLSGSSPISDATSTGAELSAPSAEDATETGQREGTDAELYHEASVAFERGDLDASKGALEKLIRRNPGFEGAPELLVRVNQKLRHTERSPDPMAAPAPPDQPHPAPTEGQLFYRARLALESGDLEASKRELEALLRTNPSFKGASELLLTVQDEIWKKSLPMSFQANHNHRIGGCAGTLTLASWGVRYSSTDHEWQWKFDEIRLLERDGRSILNLETRESDVLSLGKAKNYRFELRDAMQDEDWSRYERLAR